MVKSDAVCKILLDENLLHIAQEYLQVKPIIDLVTMWWSAPFDNKGTNAAAQEFHFDMDRIKFLKFFIYLTDVNPNTGPHCYVPKSHKKLPKALRKDGRFSDALVKENVGEPIEISGKKGTLLAVDTRGLHKGKPLTEGHRLLFQLEFTNSLFGQSYPLYNIPSTVKANFQEMSKKYKRTFKNFRSS